VARLELPEVTLCAATSVNVSATVAALVECLDRVEFAACHLFTDQTAAAIDARIRVVSVPKMRSGKCYSDFILTRLVDFVETSHCLIAQWDGFVVDASAWDATFLDYDYIGAPWPQFADGRDVGNGGFSLRSRALLQACADPRFVRGHPEDVAICRTNRELLESKHGIHFAPREIAGHFAFEREARLHPTFGFHGVFNMIEVLGADRFWQIYRSLDDRRTALVDYRRIMRDLGTGTHPRSRQLRFSLDCVAGLAGN
jgi:hypothetical protein